MEKCACGCGGEIIFKEHHKRFGIPKYLPFHYQKIYWSDKKNRETMRKKIKTLYENGNKSKMGFTKGKPAANKKYWDNRNSYRRIAYEHYGKKCNKCGINDMRVLTVHHKDRNRLNNKITNLEVLCYNCHYLNHSKKYRK